MVLGGHPDILEYISGEVGEELRECRELSGRGGRSVSRRRVRRTRWTSERVAEGLWEVVPSGRVRGLFNLWGRPVLVSWDRNGSLLIRVNMVTDTRGDPTVVVQ